MCKKIRYSIKFNKSFGYSATWKEGDRQVVIDVLKKECLTLLRKQIKWLSEIGDKDLLEFLEEQEYEDK